MGITGFFENLPRRFHYLLIALLIGLLGGIGFLLIRHQMNAEKPDQALSPADPEASLMIRNFRHNAVKEGRKQWSLSASTASMYAKQDMVRLSEISAQFHLDDGRTVTLTADEGELQLNTQHMTISGHVTAEMPGYSLKSESLHYNNETNIIQSNRPVAVDMPSGRLTADLMTYHLDRQILICEGNVKGILNEAGRP